ncbi:hypothetical protein BC941DRAFT_413600 [Chlamydoabsidia padenii]|nr:hypothetical protein BC941DRAFT_413600 [Chlamydoabsidia padenii]
MFRNLLAALGVAICTLFGSVSMKFQNPPLIFFSDCFLPFSISHLFFLFLSSFIFFNFYYFFPYTMDSYLSNIDNYIQEQDENQQQQQLFYLQQQQQSSDQQPVFNPSTWPGSFNNDTYGQPIMSIPQQSMYVPNMMNYPANSVASPHPGFDLNGNPIKIRKKPGRKPNPASPALRKAQNRAAQRAFRERKERHLRDLENTIRTLREQRNSTAKELKKTKNRLEVYKTENWYLKGVMLTLQFMCMHHNIDLPPHTPYLAEEALVEMGKTHPHAIEAYVNAYTRNNINLKPNLTAHFANLSASEHKNDGKSKAAPSTPCLDNLSLDNNNNNNNNTNQMDSADSISSPPPLIPPPDEMDHQMMTKEEETQRQQQPGHDDRASTPSAMSVSTAPVFEHEDVAKWTMDDAEEDDEDEKDAILAATSSMGAIQRIRLQLRVQSTLSTISGDHLPSVRLQPTLLQLAIAHDPRIDLIPAPQMRDRMIIFRDLLNYDDVFTLLLNGAVYHGGDPTLSQSWELPPSFHSEYWFLSSRYDLDTTNRWRRLKNLPEIPPGGPDRRWSPPPGLSSSTTSQQQSSLNGTHGWSDTAHSPDASSYFISSPQPPSSSSSSYSPSTLTTTTRQSKHPLYDKVLGSPPEMRHPVTSPTLDVMMTMMNSLSTDQANVMNNL